MTVTVPDSLYSAEWIVSESASDIYRRHQAPGTESLFRHDIRVHRRAVQASRHAQLDPPRRRRRATPTRRTANRRLSRPLDPSQRKRRLNSSPQSIIRARLARST